MSDSTSRVSGDELRKLREDLLERKRAFANDVHSLGEESGAGSGVSNHPADQASDATELELSLERAETSSGRLREIDEALLRLEDGSYGLCESCGLPIALGRLEAIPYARLCLSCQSEEEGA